MPMPTDKILDALYDILKRTDDPDTIAELYKAIKYHERGEGRELDDETRTVTMLLDKS